MSKPMKPWRAWHQLKEAERVEAERLHNSGRSMFHMDMRERELVSAYRTHNQTQRSPTTDVDAYRERSLRSADDDEDAYGSWGLIVRAYEEMDE